MDASADELVRDVKELTVQMAKVATQMEIWTPILERQTAGLTNQENRITRLEDALENFKQRREEDRKADREEAEDRVKTAGLWLSIAALALTILAHFWK